MNLNVKHNKTFREKKKNRRKSSGPRAKQRSLKLVTKSIIH